MKWIVVLIFAGVILASCDAIRQKRQIEERYPSQFGNQFFGNQGAVPQFFQFPGQGQFSNNQFPNQNQRPNNNQQQFNQNQNQFNPNGQQQQQFNPNGQQQQQFNPNGQQQQQFNPNGQQQQQFNGNGQQQQPQRNPNTQQQQQATQPTPTTRATTLSPAVENCRDGCTSRTTAEYNPVCGSDNMNYHNQARLECARDCGVNVSTLRRGTCGQAGRS